MRVFACKNVTDVTEHFFQSPRSGTVKPKVVLRKFDLVQFSNRKKCTSLSTALLMRVFERDNVTEVCKAALLSQKLKPEKLIFRDLFIF